MLNRIKKRVAHWSPAYLWNRCKLAWRQKTRPLEPWLVQEVVEFLEGWLRDTDIGVEWGSGRSTAWFASRVRNLVSVEHNDSWFNQTQTLLQNISNVELLYKPIGNASLNQQYSEGVAKGFEKDSLDFCLVDGRLRDECALTILDKIKPAGLLIVDNIDRYLPSNLKTPASRRGYGSDIWLEFDRRTADWRTVWFCDGITATAIWFKPVITSKKRYVVGDAGA